MLPGSGVIECVRVIVWYLSNCSRKNNIFPGKYRQGIRKIFPRVWIIENMISFLKKVEIVQVIRETLDGVAFRDFDSWRMIDCTCGNTVCKLPDKYRCARQWITKKGETFSRATQCRIKAGQIPRVINHYFSDVLPASCISPNWFSPLKIPALSTVVVVRFAYCNKLGSAFPIAKPSPTA